jgi:uncharacterized protein (DUF488 family)
LRGKHGSRSRAPSSGEGRLFTVGYEGKDVEGLLALLHDESVRVLVDVRELPLSRKRGFSKTRLRQELEEAGIDYVHCRALGSPRPMRRQLRETGDYAAFFRAYNRHLDKQREALAEVRTLLRESSVCLMCYEAEASRCHRSAVAARLAQAPEAADVIHR